VSCRWCNQLNPEVRKEPFSEEEDRALLAAHEKYGNKWAAIAKELPGR
jgi:myb proto-oncogene protein